MPKCDVANLIDLGESQDVHGYDKAAQADRGWRWRTTIVRPKAKIVGKDTIEVWSEEIKDPKRIVGLRYAWLGLPKYNLDGLPAFPLRTDRMKFGLQIQLDPPREQR